MEARAKLLGHPIHQMLIPLPLGLLAGAFLFDLLAIFTKSEGPMVAAWYMIAAGVVFGLIAAIFGLIDYLAIPPGTRAKRVGATHGIGNVIVVVLFAVSWFLRWEDPGSPGALAIALAGAGFLLAGVTGWLGGELVNRLSIGVDDGAHPDAPSSLKGKA
jgi:uncharacterized membrane protein